MILLFITEILAMNSNHCVEWVGRVKCVYHMYVYIYTCHRCVLGSHNKIFNDTSVKFALYELLIYLLSIFNDQDGVVGIY